MPHQTPAFDSKLPFFYRDKAREYFVVPTIYYQNGNYFTIKAPEYVYDPFYKAEYRSGRSTMHSRRCWSASSTPAVPTRSTPRTAARSRRAWPESRHSTSRSYYLPTSYVLSPLSAGGDRLRQRTRDTALYNWEMFYHAPFLIANCCPPTSNSRTAKHWYEYVFNPAGPAHRSCAAALLDHQAVLPDDGG